MKEASFNQPESDSLTYCQQSIHNFIFKNPVQVHDPTKRTIREHYKATTVVASSKLSKLKLK